MGGTAAKAFRVLLPSSFRPPNLEGRRERLVSTLADRLRSDVSVEVAASYPEMERAIRYGLAEAAWAPPIVCAHLEVHGGRVLARVSRRGATSYRAALVARADRRLSLDALASCTAAWVDRWSAGGYLLALAFLRARRRGADGPVVAQERFLGSYAAALDEVLAGRADLTACYAPGGGSAGGADGWVEMVGARAAELATLAHTEETPSDGVVVGNAVDARIAERLRQALLGLDEEPDGRELLQGIFEADRLTAVPPRAYRSVYRLVLDVGL